MSDMQQHWGILEKKFCRYVLPQVFESRVSGNWFICLNLGSAEQIFAKIYVSGAEI